MAEGSDVIPFNAALPANQALIASIQAGSVVIGVLSVTKWTHGVAFVKNAGSFPRDVCIESIQNRGGALPGDIVAVQLLPQSGWKAVESAGARKAGNDKDESDVAPTLERDTHCLIDPKTMVSQRALNPLRRLEKDTGAPEPTWPSGLQPRGTVIEVLERRSERRHPCRFFDPKLVHNGPVQPSRYYTFKPYDEAFPNLTIYGRDIPQEFHEHVSNYLFLCEIVPSTQPAVAAVANAASPPPPVQTRGQVICSLGNAGTVDGESMAIAATYHVKQGHFSDEVEECVQDHFTMPTKAELKEMGRRDLREEEFVCTIDPATARDLDDALSCVKTPGGYRVGVHIADVSHFVPIGSAMDEEARERTTSVYFVERVVPMLPRALSEDYCSLNQGVDKFAFSVIWHFDRAGNLQQESEWFGQSVIRSRCRMAYGDAQRIIDGSTDFASSKTMFFDDMPDATDADKVKLRSDVAQSVRNLHELAAVLREGRKARGALSLNRSKMGFAFEDVNSRLAPQGFYLSRTQAANWVVEEFMLLANFRVAEKICEFLPDSALLRAHGRPGAEKLQRLAEAAAAHGLVINTKSSTALGTSLEKYANEPVSDALRTMATYCMQLAKYTCCDMSEPRNMAHYALAAPVYTHFTSPIRRYCDLVVHRQLLLALELERYYKKHGPSAALLGREDMADLRYGYHYMHPSDVEDFATNANINKENARKASDASTKLFFCLYLDALRIQAAKAGGPPFVPYVRATCTRVLGEKFTLYAPAVALDVEVFHNATTQRWKGENEVDEENFTFKINWGPAPGKKEDFIEEAGAFFECVVELQVVKRGILSIDMKILPPWERSSVTEIPRTLFPQTPPA